MRLLRGRLIFVLSCRIPLIFSLHPLARLVLSGTVAYGTFSASLVVQGVSVIAIALLQCPRPVRWRYVAFILVIITAVTFVVGSVIHILEAWDSSASPAAHLGRLWLLLLSLPILALYVSVLSPVDWLVVSNLIPRVSSRVETILTNLFVTTAALQSAIVALRTVAGDILIEMQSRRMFAKGRRLNAVPGALFVFVIELLRIALEFHEEWHLRFHAHRNTLRQLSYRWRFVDWCAVIGTFVWSASIMVRL